MVPRCQPEIASVVVHDLPSAVAALHGLQLLLDVAIATQAIIQRRLAALAARMLDAGHIVLHLP